MYLKQSVFFPATLGALLSLPQLVFAQAPTSFAGLVDLVLGIINLLIPALFALVFVFFVWKLIDSWILNAGDETKRNEGKQYALWALLMFVLMVSTWGIVAMIRSSVFPN